MQFSICDVYQNITFKKLEELTVNEQSLLLNYLLFWNWKGRKSNNITPRNSFLRKQMGVSENTYYKARKGLRDKGFILVETQRFNKKGKQKPAIIRLAEWIIRSNKVDVTTQQSNQKTEQKEIPEVRQTLNKPISVAKLEQYGKDLAVQIGANTAVYTRQLERIKGYETKTSKEVIKLVREYTEKHNNSNAWAYYEATLEDMTKNHVENVADLEKYNPRLAGQQFRWVQQQLPLLTVVKGNRKAKSTSYKPKYVHGKRVEQGTDWKKKEAEERIRQARKWLGLSDGEPYPVEYQGLTNEQIYDKAYKETNQAEKTKELQQFFQNLENELNIQ